MARRPRRRGDGKQKSPGSARAFLIWMFVHFAPANLWFAWSVLRATALTERL